MRLKKGTGAGALTTRAVPQSNSATALWVAPALQGGKKGELGEGRGPRLPVTFKVRGQWHGVAHSTSWKCHTI